MILDTPGNWRSRKPQGATAPTQQLRPGIFEWTDVEEDTLRAVYPDLKALYRALPHRSARAIRNRCHILGLKRKDIVCWTNPEIKLLREVFPDAKRLNRGNFKSLFPRHPDWASIKRMAFKQGVKRKDKSTATDRPHPDPIIQAIRLRARELGFDMSSFCALLGRSPDTLKPSCVTKTTNWTFVAKAVDELGGRLAIVWAEDEPEEANATPLTVVRAA